MVQDFFAVIRNSIAGCSLEGLPRESNLIPYNDPYDFFRRYITLGNLTNITNSKEGRFTEAQAADALNAVSPSTVIAAEGAMRPLPINMSPNALPFDREKAIGKSYNYLKTPSRK